MWPGDPAEVDFFISRRGEQAAVAQEVAQVLLDADYTVLVQDFDIPVGQNYACSMQCAMPAFRQKPT